ncbi:MAG: LOG family protein [Gammaproteobacteria bacterium]|nr:LOG family protein [Gammaproteobacteria bacterium]
MDTTVTPEGSLELLSQSEVNQLLDTSQGGLYELYRRCSLAVLNWGGNLDDGKRLMEQFEDFSIRVVRQERGIKLELKNAPTSAFVDETMIRGIKEHLFAVLRDLVYTNNVIMGSQHYDLTKSSDITNAVFHILRNAEVLMPRKPPDLIVCWGGHSINRNEYDYTKEVGYELGLRGLNVCTGCGPGAMKGPMKGAAIGHAKQRISNGRYIGITEPGIIAAESPNPIVNELAIMPDIEKRLEAFVRLGHGIIVFAGGVGTAEEILHLLGILLHPENQRLPFPLILTGPASSSCYFQGIDDFIRKTLGKQACQLYRITIDDPAQVAREIKLGVDVVQQYRMANHDAYHFNWLLKMTEEFQTPFLPTHESMRNLELHRDQPAYLLAANLRRAFSGIVSGNVKEEGIKKIERFGPFELTGDPTIIKPFEALLGTFIDGNRMKLPGTVYRPCFRIVG